MSDSDFCDDYNELPSMVHVINAMNKELDDLREEKEEEIAQLKIENEKLKVENRELKMERYKRLFLSKTAMTNTMYQIPTPVNDYINNIFNNTTFTNLNN